MKSGVGKYELVIKEIREKERETEGGRVGAVWCGVVWCVFTQGFPGSQTTNLEALFWFTLYNTNQVARGTTFYF